MATIELRGLAHSYLAQPRLRSDWALQQHLNIKFSNGGSYALLGPSGCGKTTMLNIISGLLRPSEGQVLFDGIDVSTLPPEKRNIAQIFQFPVVYDTMTVRQNLVFPLINRALAATEIETQVSRVAELLDLATVLDRRVAALTADLKQKIALGRGLVRTDAKAILFDEPLAVIDPHSKWQLRANFKRLRLRVNFTMIYVTHDQLEALTLAETVLVMHEGRIVQIGTPQELFDMPLHTFVGYFIGSPSMNLLPCQVGKDGVAKFASRRIASASAAAPAGAAEIGVRPEFVRFNDDGMPTTIHGVRHLGRNCVIDLEVAGRHLKMSAPEGIDIPAEPRVCFEPERTYIYVDGELVLPAERPT